MVLQGGVSFYGVRSVEGTWYDADGQSVGGTVVVAEGVVVRACADGSGKLAVWDALELAVSEALRDLGGSCSFLEWYLELGFSVA